MVITVKLNKMENAGRRGLYSALEVDATILKAGYDALNEDIGKKPDHPEHFGIYQGMLRKNVVRQGLTAMPFWGLRS